MRRKHIPWAHATTGAAQATTSWHGGVSAFSAFLVGQNEQWYELGFEPSTALATGEELGLEQYG